MNWLLNNGKANNPEEAVAMGNVMLKKDLFHHVLRDHDFKNKYKFYRFWDDEKEKGHGDEERSWKELLADHDGKLLQEEELKEALSGHSDFLEKWPDLEELLLDE